VRRSSIKQLFLIWCYLIAPAVPWAAQEAATVDVHEVAKRVDERYNHLSTLRADFEENYQGGGMQRTASGTLWLKRPGKMRWEYLQPRHKLFISDGKRTFFYVFGENQAREADVKNTDDLRSPLRYLLGKSKLEKEFEGLRVAPAVGAEAGTSTLVGRPRALADRVEEVQLVINPASQIVRIVILALDGSRTEFRFHGLSENPPATESLFRFSAPPGVQIIRGEEAAGP
jgi:outer membrane lipoprotein carrier protein